MRTLDTEIECFHSRAGCLLDHKYGKLNCRAPETFDKRLAPDGPDVDTNTNQAPR